MTAGDAFNSLAEELEALFGRGVDADLSEGVFTELALRVFRVQFEGNTTYRAFCEARGATPDSVTRWQDVPAVPSTAFKYVDLAVGAARDVATVFRTSGTTRGGEIRGRHLVPRPSLYRAALLPNLGTNLVPEDAPLPILSLIPSPEDAPESSLSAMMGVAAERWGDPVRWLAHPDTGPDVDGFLEAAGEVIATGRAALVAGTAFAFVHVLDELASRGEAVTLPEGSRIMETGGFKGRSRTVARDDLYLDLQRRLGVPVGRVINEYGMTELLSQLYEPLLREGPGATRRHVSPPWLRVRALDPTTLEPVVPGTNGLLCFFDLANAGSVSHVLTEDVGTVSPDGVRLQGRVAGAEPRGCSLALEEILTVSAARR